MLNSCRLLFILYSYVLRVCRSGDYIKYCNKAAFVDYRVINCCHPFKTKYQRNLSEALKSKLQVSKHNIMRSTYSTQFLCLSLIVSWSPMTTH